MNEVNNLLIKFCQEHGITSPEWFYQTTGSSHRCADLVEQLVETLDCYATEDQQ